MKILCITAPALARMTAGSAPRPTDVSFCWKRKTPSSTEGERAGDGERAGEVTTDKVIVPGVPLELHKGKEEAKADKQQQATASKPACAYSYTCMHAHDACTWTPYICRWVTFLPTLCHACQPTTW